MGAESQHRQLPGAQRGTVADSRLSAAQLTGPHSAAANNHPEPVPGCRKDVACTHGGEPTRKCRKSDRPECEARLAQPIAHVDGGNLGCMRHNDSESRSIPGIEFSIFGFGYNVNRCELWTWALIN